MSDASDAAESAAERADQETTNVAIRDSIHERVVARTEATDFEDAAEYIEYTLEEVLSRVENDDTAGAATTSDPLDREGDEESNEEVEDRLESLGYL